MVATGLTMLLMSWLSVFFMLRRKAGISALPQPMIYGFVAMSFAGWLATLAGWYTTEIGRQPWLVHGVLTTKQAVADVPAPLVGSTLVAYLVVYALLLAAYIYVLFYLARKAALGETLRSTTPQSGEAIPRQLPAE